jgi:hypothetical protein
VLIALVSAAIAAANTAIVATQLHALRGAGLNGAAPPNAPVLKKLVNDLTDNAMWVIGTGLGLVLVVVTMLVIFGSVTGIDKLFRVGAGILILLVGIPTILA